MRPFPVTLAAALAVALLLAACTSGSDEAGSESPAPTTGAAAEDASTTTTIAPVILSLGETLALVSPECFAELEPATTTTSTTIDDDAPATEPTVPDTLPVTTTIPRAPTVAIVDCGGSWDGQVYAVFCLGVDPEELGRLTALACPGDPELEYPGDRTIRRAAARICLQRFSEAFGEDYGVSTRTAGEFVPTEGLWERGDRRVVCHNTGPLETIEADS